MIEQQKTAHKAEIEVKERAYQAEIKQLKDKLQRQVAEKPMARVPSWHLAEDQPTPAIPEPVRDRTPLSLGLAVNDKKPIAVPSGQGGQVNLLNPNVLAFVHACAFVGPIGREDGDTADDPIHQDFHVHARVLSVSRQDRPRRTRSRCCAKKVFKPSACVICLDSQLLRT